MTKSRFKTKLSRKQKRRNILAFFVVFVCSYAFTLFFSFSIGIFEGWNKAEIYLLGLAMTFFVISMTLFPVILAAVMLGLQRGRAKRVRDDSTFIPIHNIEYYRDNLSQISPSIASILVDLDIYGQKDIVASLLRMQNKKVISFEKNGVAVADPDAGRLDEGERELLYLILNDMLQDKRALFQWKQNRFREAEQMGYIKKVDAAVNGKTGVKTLPGILSFVCSLCLWGIFLAFDFHYKFTSLAGAITVFIFLLAIDLLLFMPVYLLCRNVSYNKRGDVLWERTPFGNEMSEKIAGLSRFIHEFSLLSEAKKEQVALWEDYLIYAIVLEENDQIVEEISGLYKGQYKIKLRRLGLRL